MSPLVVPDRALRFDEAEVFRRTAQPELLAVDLDDEVEPRGMAFRSDPRRLKLEKPAFN